MQDEVRSDLGRFAITPLWLIERVGPNAVYLWSQLAARWADRDAHSCYPSRKTLADVMNMSLRTVDRAIAELVDAGALTVIPRVTADGDRTSNLYSLHFIPISDAGHATSDEGWRHQCVGGGDTSDEGVATGEHQEPESVELESFEPYPSMSLSPSSSTITTERPTAKPNPSPPTDAAAPPSPVSPQDGTTNIAAGGVPSQDPRPRASTRSTGRQDKIIAVFTAWVEIMGKDAARVKLNAKRKSKINARLDEGYSADELISAIKGAKANDWLMGKNEQKVAYDDIPTILRDGSAVERHRDYEPPANNDDFHAALQRARKAS